MKSETRLSENNNHCTPFHFIIMVAEWTWKVSRLFFFFFFFFFAVTTTVKLFCYESGRISQLHVDSSRKLWDPWDITVVVKQQKIVILNIWLSTIQDEVKWSTSSLQTIQMNIRTHFMGLFLVPIGNFISQVKPILIQHCWVLNHSLTQLSTWYLWNWIYLVFSILVFRTVCI